MGFIEKSLKSLLTEAEEKSILAQSIAEQVIVEKKRVETERAAAATETRLCEEIKVRQPIFFPLLVLTTGTMGLLVLQYCLHKPLSKPLNDCCWGWGLLWCVCVCVSLMTARGCSKVEGN